MNEFCAKKGIKREFSMARTPQQNGENRTLIEAARTMLGDSLLPIPFWAESVNTACYVLNRALVTKPQTNTPYELLIGYLLGYSTTSKAFRVYNKRTKRVEENLHIDFLEDQPNMAGTGPNWITQDFSVSGSSRKRLRNSRNTYCFHYTLIGQRIPVEDALDDATRQASEEEKRNIASQKRATQTTSFNKLSTVRSSVSTATTPYVRKIPIDVSTLPNADLPIDPTMHDLEDDSDAFSNNGIFNGAYDDETDHPKDQILGDPKSAVQTRGKIQKASSAQQALKNSRIYHKPYKMKARKKAIGTKWVFKNKRDERSIVVKNKARLIAQGFRQEEGIDYDEVFAPVTKIEAIRLFLAFASYMGFTLYQMDVKSAFLYGSIEEEVYVHQPPGFVDPAHLHKVYKVIKALYGLHQALRAWYETLSSFLIENGFRRVKQQPDGIFISQDKYVADILKKFDFWSIRTATTPIESNKPLVKDEDGEDVDVHVYRSMIGSLMYLTASRPDIMFAVCACARFQVTPKASHLNAVKRIFSDYGGASIDRKSTISGCQFLDANCCRQVLWIQNQMMDYGFNFMNTKIHIDNESTISVIKNPVAHSRTKHIEIRFHFIRDCYEKRLIEVIKIHTDSNVADLLTKGFDVTRFNFLVVSIGMLNL
ncbi:putative ribonuclease H-like domain-containing protein [Tanacetum coccineum]